MRYDNVDEIWLPVVGLEGSYEVSNLGRIRSLSRVIMRRDGKPKTITGRFLTQRTDRDGYPVVTLSEAGRPMVRRVHRMVATAFYGEPQGDLVACHNDGNPQNNHVDNLRWDTVSGNCKDRVAHGRHELSERNHCPRNHPLEAPNLKRGHPGRTCLACSRAKAKIRRNPGLDLQATSDEYFSAIVA
jgi:hypothetical protein